MNCNTATLHYCTEKCEQHCGTIKTEKHGLQFKFCYAATELQCCHCRVLSYNRELRMFQFNAYYHRTRALRSELLIPFSSFLTAYYSLFQTYGVRAYRVLSTLFCSASDLVHLPAAVKDMVTQYLPNLRFAWIQVGSIISKKISSFLVFFQATSPIHLYPIYLSI